MKSIVSLVLIICLLNTCDPNRKDKDDLKDNITKLFLLNSINKAIAQFAAQNATGQSEYDNLKTYYSTMKNMDLQVVY